MAYKAAREWGIQPSEFRALSPWEFWLEFDTKTEIAEKIKATSGGKFSGPEWDRARRIHAEKMRGKE